MMNDRTQIKIDLELVERLRVLGLTDEMIANYYGMTEDQFQKQLAKQVHPNDEH